MTSDADLLRQYAERRSDIAFAELVQRHLNLVYFAALRRTGGNAALAEDVTQEVFTTVASKAGHLAQHATITGWLYTTTRFTAAKAVRAEERRKRREREAHIMNEGSRGAEPAVDWEKLKPVIDEALDELDENDREAVLLRCLQGQPFREVGALLRLSEDSARKRVDRALEKLRQVLAARGLTSTATGLAVALSGQAGAAMPPGLVATVTTTALKTVVASGWLVPAMPVLLSMSIMKITVATVVVLGAVGATTAFYLNTRSHDEAAPENPGQKIVAAAGPVSASGPGADDIRTLQQENERLRRIINALEGSDGDGVREKIARLRSMLERLPEQRIPEFELLTEDDWYAAVDGPLESVEDYRVALSKLRGRAETRFAAEVQPALRTFLTAHGDKFPNTVAELKPFLERSLGDAMLGRYRIVGAADIPNVKMGGDWIITQTTLVDSTYDSRVVIGPKGHGSTNRKPQEAAILEPVMKAFAEANAGVAPQHPAQLLPFATTPEQKAALERLSRSSPRRPEGKSTLPAGSK